MDLLCRTLSGLQAASTTPLVESGDCEHIRMAVVCWRRVEATSFVFISELSAAHCRGGVNHAFR